MSRDKKKSPFKKHETGYHKAAVETLARWVDGVAEQPFMVDGSIVFVPDVTCYKNGVLDCIYEVVYSHPLTGKKIGMIEYWSYLNSTPLTVFEVSHHFILKQTEKPERIETLECYIIDPLIMPEVEDDEKLKVA